MSIELASIILGIAGSIIMILLGIIGYFLKRLHSSVDSLESTVNKLFTAVEVDKERQKGLEKMIDNHETRICKLEKK